MKGVSVHLRFCIFLREMHLLREMACNTSLCAFIPDIGTNPHGMTLPRTARVRHNSIHTIAGRFRSCLHKWVVVRSAACERWAEEPTVDDVVLHFPVN